MVEIYIGNPDICDRIVIMQICEQCIPTSKLYPFLVMILVT